MHVEKLTHVATGRRRRLVAAAYLPIFALAISVRATPPAAQVASPMVEGPITGGNGTPFIAATTFDLAQVGYMQEEYFFSGTATADASANPLTSDGSWTVTPASTAAYKTRVLVYRPVKRSKFRGTVVVEWLGSTSVAASTRHPIGQVRTPS
jgi:hypothetical protein